MTFDEWADKRGIYLSDRPMYKEGWQAALQQPAQVEPVGWCGNDELNLLRQTDKKHFVSVVNKEPVLDGVALFTAPPAAVPDIKDKEIALLRGALQFYADGHHFTQHDPNLWDTVSGEPSNFYEDEACTATVEDGTIAKFALDGVAIVDEDELAAAPKQGE